MGAGRWQGFTRVWTSVLGGARARLRSRGSRASALSGLRSSGAAPLPGAWAPTFLAREATCSLAMGQPLGATSAHVAQWLHSAGKVASGSCVAEPPPPCVLHVRVRETQLLGCLC